MWQKTDWLTYRNFLCSRSCRWEPTLATSCSTEIGADRFWVVRKPVVSAVCSTLRRLRGEAFALNAIGEALLFGRDNHTDGVELFAIHHRRHRTGGRDQFLQSNVYCIIGGRTSNLPVLAIAKDRCDIYKRVHIKLQCTAQRLNAPHFARSKHAKYWTWSAKLQNNCPTNFSIFC